MLALEHPRCEADLVIARQHCDPRLQHGRSAVELRRHEVDRATVHEFPGLEHPPMGMQALVARQQRGMDVDQAAGQRLHELCRQDAHISGEHDELDVERYECGQQAFAVCSA